MEKITIFILLLSISIHADILQQNCLGCHQKQQIPSQLIYKRYLLKYSTPKRIQKAIFAYLKKPKKENSIMPPQFFLKFPMKEESSLQDKKLHEIIELFLKRYDLKKRLVIQ